MFSYYLCAAVCRVAKYQTVQRKELCTDSQQKHIIHVVWANHILSGHDGMSRHWGRVGFLCFFTASAPSGFVYDTWLFSSTIVFSALTRPPPARFFCYGPLVVCFARLWAPQICTGPIDSYRHRKHKILKKEKEVNNKTSYWFVLRGILMYNIQFYWANRYIQRLSILTGSPVLYPFVSI